MKSNWSNPEPTPKQLAAWANGELDRREAERVEAWLIAHPDAAGEAESASWVGQLYRDHSPVVPSEREWQAVLQRVEADLWQSARASGRISRPTWRLRLLLGLAATAAVLGGLALARFAWPERPAAPAVEVAAEKHDSALAQTEEPDEPFPVATVSEVNIISIDVEDADRIVIGQPLLGTFKVAAPDDIEVVEMERHEDGRMPRLHRGPEVPMIVVAAADREDP